MQENDKYLLKSEDFPALYRVADATSLKAQKRYLWLFRLDLFLLVLGAVFSSISFEVTSGKFVLFLLGGISFMTSLVVTIAIKGLGFEKTWYGGRAIAESVKSLAWHYMACARPFLVNLDARRVDEIFLSDLEDIIKERRQLLGKFTEEITAQPQITARMREIRKLELNERKDFYIKGRVLDQREWYGNNAGKNQKKESRWFIAVMIIQFLAGLAAFFLVSFPDFPVNLTSILSATAMGFLAWLQVKRHQELSQSYNVAAQELASIADLSAHIKTDEELADFAANAESAMSREHKLWIARRDQSV